MPEPSVKGSLFKGVWDEVHRHLTQGAITRDMLAQALKPEELETLDREVAIAAWYPIGTYARLLRFLRDTVGDGSDEWLRRSGEESARRMVGLGIYGQLDERSEAWEKRVGKMMVTLAPAIFSFSHWAMEEADGESFRIVITEAGPMPEEVAVRAHGFVHFLAERAAGGPVAVRYERPAPGPIVFRSRRTG
jgi:hypothetical protein